MLPTTAFEPLTVLERTFLHLDRRNQPLHLAYLGLLRPPPGAGADFVARLFERLRRGARPAAPFDRRLRDRHGFSTWVEDAGFDFEHHLVRLSLPQPAGMGELMDLASRLHAGHLDRAYPLWRLYLIEGLEDGRLAVYCKMHHAYAGGLAGTRHLLETLSSEPHRAVPLAGAESLPPAAGGQGRRERLIGQARALLRALPRVAAEARQTLREVRAGCRETVVPGQAPACMLNNQPISHSRQFAAASIPLRRLDRLGSALGYTVDELVLALCASALRRYLEDQDALPERSLIALLPGTTSLPAAQGGPGELPALVNLATDQGDALQRLAMIRGCLARSRERRAGWGAAEVWGHALATGAQGLVNQLLRPRRGHLAFNVMISRFSGPQVAAYWEGCRLEQLYPLSFVMRS